MVKLVSKFEPAFDCDVPKTTLKKALKNELYNSFAVKDEKNTNAMIEYLIDNFFWEFFYHFKEELTVLFLQNGETDFGGET